MGKVLGFYRDGSVEPGTGVTGEISGAFSLGPAEFLKLSPSIGGAVLP